MFRKKEEEKKDEVHSKEAEKMPVDGENIEGREPQSEIYEEAEVHKSSYSRDVDAPFPLEAVALPQHLARRALRLCRKNGAHVAPRRSNAHNGAAQVEQDLARADSIPARKAHQRPDCKP